eukprot:c8314_g1_i1.p1 GENE.c8314_g1_i1~~c8314_g1_i1.p1  ORF type:complete len:362 (+),score=143.78 c8314_g1_i1:144-1229(+)
MIESEDNNTNNNNNNEKSIQNESNKKSQQSNKKSSKPQKNQTTDSAEITTQPQFNDDISLIDIGANLTDPMFSGIYNDKNYHEGDLNEILNRAKNSGVKKVIITGGSLSESRAALNISRKIDKNLIECFCTIGVHPTKCKEFENENFGGEKKYFEDLRELIKDGLKDNKVIAIGECGLDYDRIEFCDKETQIKYFNLQFDLAEEFKLPMFLHNRNTNGDFVSILSKQRNRIKGGVSHSFTGSLNEMNEIINLNIFIGLNGCSLKTEEGLTIAKEIPNDWLLIETDCPWCEIKPTSEGYKYIKTFWPTKKKEKFQMGFCVKNRQEICHIRNVLEVISAVKNINSSTLSEQIYKNTISLFFSN